MSINVNDVTVKFGEKTILSKFNHSFEENCITAIIGQSGCGKTTLLRTISGLLSPTEGEVIYEGKKITKPNKDIFMMHQNYTNFPWKNCIDNVLFPIKLQRKVREEDVKLAYELLVKVGLGDHVKKYPDELSGGMKQRLSLARVLMSKPKVILMDEPLSALDDVTRVKMQDLIMGLQKETKSTVIMITHNKNDANKMADHIINLS